MQRLEIEWHGITEQFRLVLQHQHSDGIVFNGADLLQKNTLDEVLAVMERKLKTNQRPVLGSLLVKHYARILCGVLYAMSRLQLGLDASLANVRLEFGKELEPGIVLRNANPVPAPARGREAWRNGIVKSLFADNLQPLIQRVFTVAHLSPCVLWENVAIYIHHFYQTWLEETETEALREQIRDDYLFVTRYAGCELFGACTENPLHIPGSCVDHPLLENKTIRIRKTCCLRYHLPDGHNCTTCPRLSDEERKIRFEEAYAVKLHK